MLKNLLNAIMGGSNKVRWATREEIDAVDETPFNSPLWGDFHLKSNYEGVKTRGGINTVKINGNFVHITDLDAQTLCSEWAKRQRTINSLHAANRKANSGWRGTILRLIGVKLEVSKNDQ